ncbi:putative cyclic nucleotide-gated ion channel 8 [Hibiscus syriacus]|uniref:Cyclic nucleotide-gated ion channel 8 n=1 Tax=Hibiscus syriacus TaxID=106335 RepID=A0A6A3A4R3_HIBSY|nr:putative cyclic nucleotide-gated ion channel 8 [Hibiscus syriacus]
MFGGAYKSQLIGGQKEKFVRLDDLDSPMSMASGAGYKYREQGKKASRKSFNIGMMTAPGGLLLLGRSLKSETIIDAFYLIRMGLQFRTTYIALLSLVIDPAQIATRKSSLHCRFSFCAPHATDEKWFFLLIASLSEDGGVEISSQIKRFRELKKTAGTFADSAWVGAAYYPLWCILASHIVGAVWYLLAVERKDTCWRIACQESGKCNIDFLYCGNKHMQDFPEWRRVRNKELDSQCALEDDDAPFNYGIYTRAIKSEITSSNIFFPKFCFCLWWGLQNLSTLGQGLETSTYSGEVLFSIAIAIFGLILMALDRKHAVISLEVPELQTCWIPYFEDVNMNNLRKTSSLEFIYEHDSQNYQKWLEVNSQTYLQSLTVRLEEMRIKRRDSELWMHYRALPEDLKERVPLFANMDERLLDAICERLKPSPYTEYTYIVREGDPVNEMLFFISGRLKSVTTDGGRSGFFNRGLLKEGDFCGEELLTWALDPKASSNLPLSTRTVMALTEVEAFSLEAQFRRLHRRQVQHTFRFYSQQCRTWAACFIQTAWRKKGRGWGGANCVTVQGPRNPSHGPGRKHVKRKEAELRPKEEEEEEDLDYIYDRPYLIELIALPNPTAFVQLYLRHGLQLIFADKRVKARLVQRACSRFRSQKILISPILTHKIQ